MNKDKVEYIELELDNVEIDEKDFGPLDDENEGIGEDE